MRKLFLIFAIVGLLMAALNATSEDHSKRDGYFWGEMPDSFRSCYVMGFADGLELSAGFFDALTEPIRDRVDSSSKGCCSVVWAYGDMLSKRRLPGITYGQMVDGIDRLYKDYRNKQIPIPFLLELVKMEVEGRSEAQIDSVARELRGMFSKKRGK